VESKVAAACVLGVLAWCVVEARPLVGAQAGAGPRGVEAVHVQGKIWMLVTPDGNLALQVGEEGALLVDTGKSGTSDAVKAAIRQVTPRPLRYVINTSAGPTRIGNNAAFGQSAGADVNAARVPGPEIIAREAVLIQMSKANYPVDAWPTDAYLERERKFRFNGEAIEIVHQPSAYSDGDSLVYFRGSDVIVAGEIYSTRRFPLVDREHGGTVEGVLAGLNRILDIAVPEVVVNNFAEGGTLVIPGGGRLSDQDDVTEYRDMVHIVRDRMVSLVKMTRSLEQVKAARPLIDYEGRYGIPEWTASMFLDALYAEVTRSTAGKGGAR
jgi:cyclase